MKLRIKIREQNNGVKQYTPQYKEYFFSEWKNIIYTDISHTSTIAVGYASLLFDTEDEALKCIEMFKINLKEKKERETKKIYYNTIR